ncbi:hypothetical protein Glove_344g57 [Diversispora epigaea]|uniref:Uncharacterized protein n=1 Tax=Diversispora epigaea TaxID=1348612 RepID=A0A397HFY6_9GLOM|nr:hypothetical protein Glove_344g57 [Diversispora epigaea]
MRVISKVNKEQYEKLVARVVNLPIHRCPVFKYRPLSKKNIDRGNLQNIQSITEYTEYTE